MIGLSEAQRFNGSDYGTWRLKFIRRAREVGLWRLYHPTKGEEDAPPSETASAQVKAAYRRKSEQAYFQLCHSVSDAIAVGLDQFADDLNSAEKAWSYMDAVYLGRSDTNLTAIKRKLLLLGMEPAESVIDYVNRAKSYNECLAAMGAAEPESHMVSYIINGLPKDWVGEKGVLTCNPPKDITRLLEMLQSLEQIRYNGVQRETLPSLEFLRVWGCMTQYREPAGPDHKLLPRTKWGVHLGICPVSKGWVIKNVDNGKVTATRDVIFYENLNYREWKDGAKAHAATDKSTNPQPVQELLGSGADGIGTASDVSAAELEDDDSPVTWVWETTPTTEGDTVAEPEGQPGDAATSGQQSDQARNDQQPPATSEASDPWRLFDADSSDEATGEIDSLLEEGAILIGREEEEQQDESQGPTEAEAESPAPAAQEEELGRGMRIKRSNQRYAMILMTCWRDVHTHLLLTTTATALISKEQRTTYDLPPEPVTIEEALTGPYKEKWRAAIQAELDTLAERGTWELVKMPEGRRPVGVKWVFKIKTGDIGQLERFKARLVAKGYTQVEGVDYGKTYASVCNLTTARTFLKVTAARDYHMVQLDITNAFLYAILKEDIYMNQPPG
ncbi:unnamed protein product, partial [Closterium sp. NIES-53]